MVLAELFIFIVGFVFGAIALFAFIQSNMKATLKLLRELVVRVMHSVLDEKIGEELGIQNSKSEYKIIELIKNLEKEISVLNNIDIRRKK